MQAAPDDHAMTSIATTRTPRIPRTTGPVRRAAARIRAAASALRSAAAEADYAQRRLLELRTGVTLTETERRRRRRVEIAWLEALMRES